MDMGAVFTIIGLVLLAFYAVIKGTDPERKKEQRIVLSAAPQAVQVWAEIARIWGQRLELDPRIILAVIWKESSGIMDQIGEAGELGLMQLKQIAIEDVRTFGYGSFNEWKTDPYDNIGAGASYLALQKKRELGDIELALRSYNQGYEGSRQQGKRFLAQSYALDVLNKAEKLGYGST